MKRNKFSKALKHLKSKKIDEKIKSLEEAAPTNNMSGVYQVTPSTGDAFRMGELDPAKKFYPKADGTWPAGIPADPSDREYVRGAGYHTGKGAIPDSQNNTPRDLSLAYMNANGNDTTTMIRASDGAVYADLPEGTRSFILGPLVTSYNQNHTYDDFTNLGYIQKDTRQFVLLAQIQGFLDGTKRLDGAARTWDGTASQFVSYNSNFTIDHALWMRDRYNEGNFTANVPFNLAGGVPADRHPDDASKAGGDVLGTDGGPAGSDSDDDGKNQDPADENDIESLELWGIEYDKQNPKPKRSDFGPGRDGRAEYEKAKRDWEKSKDEARDKEFPDLAKDKENLIDDMKDAITDFANDIKDKAGDFINDLKDAGIDPTDPLGIRDLIDSLTDKIPALDYSKDIADSIRDNEPKYTPQEDIPKEDIDKYINDLDTNSVKINTKEEPYADDNIITDKDGNVRPRSPWPTYPNGEEVRGEDLKKPPYNEQMKKWAKDNTEHPNNTKQPNKTDMPKWTLGLPNPLAAAGQSQNQVVFPEDGGEPYFKFEDHAYHNVESTDEGEVPDLGKKGLSWLIHKMANAKHNRNDNSENTGPMEGYPKNIRGDSIKVIKIPLKDMPKDFQNWANSNNPNNKNESYIMDSRKRILREVRQPLREIQELPKTTKLKGYRPNFKGKFSPQNTPDVTASKQSDDIVSAKNASRQVWTAKDKFWKGYETTERMNIIYDNLGHGSQYFDRIVGENVRQKNKKSREVQEHLNMLAHQKAMREVYGIREYEKFIDESETFDNKINDPLFTKVAKRLKKEIDYPKKPAAKGYPNEAPPKIDPNSGYHPKFGKRYKYDKLDPISARTMAGAPTGDPEIDANVKKAAKIKESWRSDLKNLWIGSEREDWKKKIKEDFVNTTQGMKVGQTFTHVPSGQTVTTSGVLGGIETLQTSVPIFGDAIPGPDASQYGLQGFAKPIDMMRRGDKKTEQLNKELDSSEEYTKEVKADKFMKARVDNSEKTDDWYKNRQKSGYYTEKLGPIFGKMDRVEEIKMNERLVQEHERQHEIYKKNEATRVKHQKVIDKKIKPHLDKINSGLDKKIDLRTLYQRGAVVNDDGTQGLMIRRETESAMGLSLTKTVITSYRGKNLSTVGSVANREKLGITGQGKMTKVAEIKDPRLIEYKMPVELEMWQTQSIPYLGAMSRSLARSAAEKTNTLSAFNVLNYFIDNHVKAYAQHDPTKANINHNLTHLYTPETKDKLRSMMDGIKGNIDLDIKAGLTNEKIRENVNNLLVQRQPTDVSNSLGNAMGFDVDYYKQTGNYRFNSTYKFTSTIDLEPRDNALGLGLRSIVPRVKFAAKKYAIPKYVAGQLDGETMMAIQNPMQFQVDIESGKQYTPSEKEEPDSKQATDKEPSKAVQTVKKMASSKSVGFDRDDLSFRRKKNFREWSQQLDDMWNSDWRDELKEGMTTQVLTGILPSTGSDILQDIPYGLTGDGTINYGSLLGNTEADPNTLVNPDDEYTALTNMASMFDAPDPRGVGQSVRTFDIATQQFNGHSNIGGSDGFNSIVPGYKLDSVRYVQLSGAHRNRALDDDPPGGYYPNKSVSGAVRLHFNGVGSPRFIAMKPVDTTEVDTLRITATRGEYSIRTQAVGGWSVDPRPMIYYWAGDHEDYQPTLHKTNPATGKTGLDATLYVSSNVNGPASSGLNRHRGVQQQRQADGWRPIHMKPDGTIDSSVNPYIIDYERPLGDNAVTLPDWARGKSARYMIFQNHSGATTYSAWDLYNVQFQRKKAMRVRSLMKPLSDVESSPFVRVGPTKKNEGGKERKKKVKDIIDGGLKYTETKFSKDFPVRTTLE